MRRLAISRKRSRKIFSKTATRTRKMNLRATPVRGGWSI